MCLPSHSFYRYLKTTLRKNKQRVSLANCQIKSDTWCTCLPPLCITSPWHTNTEAVGTRWASALSTMPRCIGWRSLLSGIPCWCPIDGKVCYTAAVIDKCMHAFSASSLSDQKLGVDGNSNRQNSKHKKKNSKTEPKHVPTEAREKGQLNWQLFYGYLVTLCVFCTAHTKRAFILWLF